MNYEIFKMNNIISTITPTTIDGFLLFYTSEDRSFNILNHLSLINILPSNIIIISPNNISNEEIKSLELKFNIHINILIISYDYFDKLIPYLKEINGYLNRKNTIGLDITCMPIPLFTQILNFIYKHHKNIKIISYYSEPNHYSLDKLFDYTAYDGEIDIKVIPGFEGKTSKLNEDKRVLFYILGFEMKYLNKIIPQEINPDVIVPINGFPSFFPKYKDIALINNDANYYEQDIEIIFAEANNPFNTYNQLIQLKNKFSTYFIDIIPAGTKPMALGACLFAIKSKNNDVRILFPFPSKYKIKQSHGSGKAWEYQI